MTPFNFIRFRIKVLITALYFGRFIMCIAFRNIFFNDFSTAKSSYRFNLTYFIFRGTTIINTKIDLGGLVVVEMETYPFLLCSWMW